MSCWDLSAGFHLVRPNLFVASRPLLRQKCNFLCHQAQPSEFEHSDTLQYSIVSSIGFEWPSGPRTKRSHLIQLVINPHRLYRSRGPKNQLNHAMAFDSYHKASCRSPRLATPLNLTRYKVSESRVPENSDGQFKAAPTRISTIAHP